MTTITRLNTLPEIQRKQAARAAEFLRKQNTHELGFIPYHTFYKACCDGKVYYAWEREIHKARGYLFFTRRDDTIKIQQLVVKASHRRQRIASRLLNLLISEHAFDVDFIMARVAADLEAVNFWDNAGFKRMCIGRPRNTRNRRIITYGFDIVDIAENMIDGTDEVSP